ncbi:TetR/AcrR family transcriptional regulator [Paracoccus sp. (in: a-proteobacteria)]|uniref:TetR/AcrR family transcriptional regulator n=1 Tax=Paracoccus sp. TaxID=267 RepID=UPI003A84AA59
MATRQKDRPTRANGDVTREKILNSAERLFGRRGFGLVSLRDITTDAGVTLALASYHFGTKENLFEQTVGRRASVMSALREERLAALQHPNVEQILDAFMAPLFERARSKEPGWRDYFRLLARLGEDNQWLDLLETHFDRTARLFHQALMQAMPDADPGTVTRAFTMVLQVMLNTVSQHGRVDRLSTGAVKATNLAEAYPVLLRFATAGMESFSR